MKKMTYLSSEKPADKRCIDMTVQVAPFSSKPITNLAFAIAALTGCLFNYGDVQAAINVPTDMPASPLCINGQCAEPFTAKMVMFEEFGLEHYSDSGNSGNLSDVLPSPPENPDDPLAVCRDMPVGADLDNFLKEDLHPMPNRAVDDSLTAPSNAWDSKVRNCVGLGADIKTFAEGRPTGEWFAHQRYDEFPAQSYFQSAMTGARDNGGLRDKKQLHEYKKGEFGPDGLYYIDANEDGTPGTEGVSIKIHPNLPTQDKNSVWTFDGTLPPKLLMAKSGEPILFRHYNALPIDVAANNGFGMHTISTHEHNGHNPAESDGYAHAYFYPGQYYDYLWPMALAGHDTYPYNDPKAGAPDGNGGIVPIRGDSRETASTHWFHDHMLDYTAQNVYKGNAAMMNIYSAIDRGREPVDLAEAETGISTESGKSNPGYACNYKNPNSPNLCFPSGNGLDWGNRDYDVNLLVADKAWDNAGQLKFNIFNTDGFLGDRMTVNWIYKPYMEVRARKYRFRILNGAVSRYVKIAIVDENRVKIPFHMIGNDGNIMQHAVPFPNSQSPESLPVQAIAERYDIIIDFKNLVGKKVYLVNLLEHQNGRAASKSIPLASVLSGSYKPDGKLGDPAVGKFLEIRVKGCGENADQVCSDFSMNPADYVEGNKQMIPLPKPTLTELQNAKHRTFEFGRSNGTDTIPWTIKTDLGAGLSADPRRVSAAPEIGKVEIWHLKSGTGWDHPVHVHFEEGQLLYRNGVAPPIWEKYARKDIYRVGGTTGSGTSVDIALRIREFAGTYVEHCHNTQHEDKAMLLRWDSFHPGQTIPIPTPELGWEGVFYSPSITLPTYLRGDTKTKSTFKLPN
ncbi:MAG: multicopper oxidase domain-containing protein [Methylococcaceae bacterium]|nr:multicopper oxidase domain-containing protein [Methylococcaceae bacterium]